MTRHLTQAQQKMLCESGYDHRDCCGFGVELRGPGDWATARNLQRLGLGTIDGDPGASLPGMYFNNRDGAALYRDIKFVDEDEE